MYSVASRLPHMFCYFSSMHLVSNSPRYSLYRSVRLGRWFSRLQFLLPFSDLKNYWGETTCKRFVECSERPGGKHPYSDRCRVRHVCTYPRTRILHADARVTLTEIFCQCQQGPRLLAEWPCRLWTHVRLEMWWHDTLCAVFVRACGILSCLHPTASSSVLNPKFFIPIAALSVRFQSVFFSN